MGITRPFRPVVDHVARFTGLLSVCERRMRRGVTVLMYHRVLDDGRCRNYALSSLVMPVSAFSRQVCWLAEHCTLKTVAEAVGSLNESLPQHRPVVCVTFDDGYVDNYETVAPILERAGVRGTFYVTAGLIGTKQTLWFDRATSLWSLKGKNGGIRRASSEVLGRESAAPTSLRAWMAMLKDMSPEQRTEILERFESRRSGCCEEHDYRLMSGAQVRDLAGRGHEVGSHTLSHPLLPQLDDRQLMSEVLASRVLLTELLGRQVRGFCYPNGAQDRRVRKAVREAGYSYACTTRPGRNTTGVNRMALRRLDITPERVVTRSGVADEVGFRAEISLLRSALR